MKKLAILGLMVVCAFLIAQSTVTNTEVIYSPLQVHGYIKAYGNVFPSYDTLYDLGDSVDVTSSYLRWNKIFARFGRFQRIWVDTVTTSVMESNDTLIRITGDDDTVYIDTIQSYWTYDSSRIFRINKDTTLLTNNYVDMYFTLDDSALTQNAFRCSVTTDNGSANNVRRAMKVLLMDGGWTGIAHSYAGYFNNLATGGKRNYGLFGWAQGDNVKNVGVKGEAQNGIINTGVYGASVDNTANAMNVGVLGIAQNQVAEANYYSIAGYFGSRDSFPPSSILQRRAVIISDNADDTVRYLVGIDNGKDVFEIADIGDSLAELRFLGSDTSFMRATCFESDSGLFVDNDSVMINCQADTTLYINSDDKYGLVIYNDNAVATNSYGIYIKLDSTASAPNRIGIYADVNGQKGSTSGNVIGGSFIAETWDTAQQTLQGISATALACGNGKKYGAYINAYKNSILFNDTVFGIWSKARGASTDSIADGLFGGYFWAEGISGDTFFGVYAKASSGAINYGGWFNPNVYVFGLK